MRTILIADEDIDTRFVSLFSDMDYRIVTTSSGADAISKAREIKPDIIMANVSLSDKDGYEVSREIKNNLLLKDTPVILLTSSLGTFDETRAVEACADDFILKPFRLKEITKKIEELKQEEKRKRQDQVTTLYKQALELSDVGQWRQALKRMREIQALDPQFPDPEGITARAQEELAREAERLEQERQEREAQERAAKEEAERKAREEQKRQEQISTLDSQSADIEMIPIREELKEGLEKEAGKSKVKYTSRRVYVTVGSLTTLVLLIVGLTWKWSNLKYQRQEEEVRQEVEARKGAETTQQLTELLAQAKRQISANRFTAPAGNNALETYREVLRVAPEQKEALEGIKRIKDRYVQLAEASKQREEWAEAQGYYEEALTIDSKDEILIAALHQVKERRRAEEESAARREAETVARRAEEAQQSVQPLTQAKKKISANRFTAPAGNNARKTHREILRVAPEHKEAMEGTKKNKDWYVQLAEEGDANAMSYLGYMYEKGIEVEKSNDEAVRWYRRAAEAGNIKAMVILGLMYTDGLKVKRDYAEAVKWDRKAAEAGIASAMTNLGYMYIKGLGVKKDYAEAARWYGKGAEAGNAKAMTNLGDMYEGGIGVEKSYNEAVRWYSKAASLGDEDAKSALKRLEESTTPQ